MSTGNPKVFIITQIGKPDSTERKRADEIAKYIIKPSLTAVGLEMYRADLDPTPGQITPQMVRELTESPVVIADLTGRNPNVYYELGIAHSFGRKTIVLCDSPDSLAFDTKDERAIALGETYPLTAEQAERAVRQLTETLKIVLGSSYVASSVVSKAATATSLDALAPDNPVVSELAIIRDDVADLKRMVKRPITDSAEADMRTMRIIIERASNAGLLTDSTLARAAGQRNSLELREWVDNLRSTIRSHAPDPWAEESQERASARDPWTEAQERTDGGTTGEPPF